MGKDAYFFSHDCNARNDQKILELRSVYGYEGYGRFWALIEMMREDAEYRIMLTEYVWNAIALQLQCDAETAHKFVSDCIENFHLFESDGKAFWSTSLHRRMNVFDEKSSRRKEAAKKAAEARWGKASTGSENGEKNAIKCDGNAKRMRTQCDGDANDASKVKESKVNKRVVVGNGENELAEVYELFSNNIHPVSGEIEADKLADMTEHYSPMWVKEAIKVAAEQHGMTVKYIEGVLKNWDANGFKAEKPRRGNDGKRNSGSGKPPKEKNSDNVDWSKYDG